MALTRIFGGKRYYFYSQHSGITGGEYHARNNVRNIREGGGHARITTEGKDINKVWIVWSRERRY